MSVILDKYRFAYAYGLVLSICAISSVIFSRTLPFHTDPSRVKLLLLLLLLLHEDRKHSWSIDWLTEVSDQSR